MRRVLLVLALAAACSCANRSVELERYRGAYSTHFDGIPDQAEICAVVRNRSGRALDWIELRMRSSSHLAERPTPTRSTWVYRGRIEPDERVALRFEHAPMADELEIAVARVGSGARGPRNARPLRLAAECSEEGLRAELDAGLAARAARDTAVHAAARLTRDAPPDPLVASP